MKLLFTQRDPCNAASFTKPETSDLLGGALWWQNLGCENCNRRKCIVGENISRRIKKVTWKVIASRFCIELQLIKTISAGKRLSRYTSALDCHLLTTATLCLRGSMESPNREDVVLSQLRTYMLGFCFLEMLNMSYLLRIHEDEPKFRAVYWKLGRKRGCEHWIWWKTSRVWNWFMRRAISVMNWLNNAFDIFILISQKKLNFWRFERLASVSNEKKNLFRLFRGEWKIASLCNRAAMGRAGCVGETRRNSLCVRILFRSRNFQVFHFHLSRVVSYERTLSAAAAPPALYSIIVLLHISSVVSHNSYELPRRKRKKLNNQRFSQQLRSLVQLNDLINN